MNWVDGRLSCHKKSLSNDVTVILCINSSPHPIAVTAAHSRNVLGAVLGALLQCVPVRQACEVSDVVIVQLRARPLTNNTRLVPTSQVVEPRLYSLIHLGISCRTLHHHLSQLVHPLIDLCSHRGKIVFGKIWNQSQNHCLPKIWNRNHCDDFLNH